MISLTRRRKEVPQEGAGSVRVWAGNGQWRGSGVPNPSDQIALFGEAIITQHPAYWPDIQKYNGVSALDPSWRVPTRSINPIWQNTQRPGNAPQMQRFGMAYTGPLGPISAQQLARGVTEAQMINSGVGANSIAASLRGR